MKFSECNLEYRIECGNALVVDIMQLAKVGELMYLFYKGHITSYEVLVVISLEPTICSVDHNHYSEVMI